MGDALPTRASLLARVRDPADRAAWQQFVDLYGSLVYGYARQYGCQDADAADLTQDVFLSLAQGAGRWRYDPAQGPFRAWLFGVVRHKLARLLQRRHKQPAGSGDSGAQERLKEEPSNNDNPDARWEQEFRQHLFRVAASRVRDRFAPSTWQAFWQTAVEGKSAAEAGAALGLSPGAVYVARSRVLARLTEEIQQMQDE